jgi:threonine/homoserine/homoserine lactone efflux protein
MGGMLLEFVLKGLSIGFSAGVTPGPLQAIFLSYAVKGGWKKALPAAFAPLVSDSPVILLVVLVLNNLPPIFLRFLRIGGGLFLLYLAWESYRAWRDFKTIAEESLRTSPLKTLLKATAMNLLAPGPWLFWSLINGPNLISAWSVSPWWGAAYLASFYGMFILSNIALIFLFAGMRRMGEKVRRGLLLLSAIILAGFGIFQFLQGLAIF